MASMVNAGMQLHAARQALTAALVNDLPSGYLTPETLLTYCASKLRGLDEQIQQIFARQQTRNAKAEVLSELQQTLSAYKGGYDGEDKQAQIDAAIAKAEQQLAGDPKLLEGIQAIKNSVNGTAVDKKANSEEVSGWTNSVQTMQQSLNQQGEMEMLQMQSMMSQRQQAVQLCTNMIQGLGQTTQQICANTGK